MPDEKGKDKHRNMLERLQIRPYGAPDAAPVIRLWNECGLVVPWNDPEKDIRRKLGVNPELFLVGELDGEIVATCMAGYEGHRGWVNYLAVSPERQRAGIAGRMMQAAEKLLRRLGCPKINVQIRTTNAEVVEFYRAIGYRVDDVVSMGKRLEEDGPGPGLEKPA